MVIGVRGNKLYGYWMLLWCIKFRVCKDLGLERRGDYHDFQDWKEKIRREVVGLAWLIIGFSLAKGFKSC